MHLFVAFTENGVTAKVKRDETNGINMNVFAKAYENKHWQVDLTELISYHVSKLLSVSE